MRAKHFALLAVVFGILGGRAEGACFTAPSGIIGWWPGQGNANDIVSTNNGALQGGATANTPGEVGTAFGFDGTNAYAQIPDSSAFHLTNLTVEAWVRFSSLNSAGSGGSPAGDQYLVFKQNSSTQNFEGFALTKTRSGGSDIFEFTVSNPNGSSASANGTGAIATNVWYHVAGVRGSNYIQLYVNGVLQQQVSVNFAQDYAALPLFFGTSGESYWDHKLAGSLDEVSLYNRVLASNEIAGIYAAGTNGKCVVLSAPVIVAQPQGLTNAQGSNAAFSVTAVGTPPLSYQWDYDSSPLAGATNSVFTLGNAQATNSGNYSVVVSNLIGSTNSAIAVLNVITPPAFITQPQSSTNDPGMTISFTAAVSGGLPMSLQWQANGTNLEDGGRISGSATTNLLVSNVQAGDVGSYVLVASNSLGIAASQPARLSVTGPLAIISQPVSQSASLGGAAVFSVLAAGTPPLSYQWQFNGMNLSDGGGVSGSATSTLSFAGASASNFGYYSVTITNGGGSVTSSLALLSLSATPAPNPTGAGTVVLVNSQSARYPDFQHFVQPYLDTFGLPYTVLDISSNPVDTNLGQYSLIIIGHAQLDTNLAYLTSAAQADITTAVSNGTGLVNLDSALSTNGTGIYSYEQNIFGSGYGPPASGTSITLPPTEAGSQMHYISMLHPTNDLLLLSNTMNQANLVLPTNATAVGLCSGKPFLVITKFGQGRAVQYSSYDWISVYVMGPVNGLDDLLWRSFVWAARKPFVMRGMPNFATMRVDDVSGPFTWVHTANSVGFKPYLALFIDSIAPADVVDLRGLVTNGGATCSIHSFTTSQFFYFDHADGVPWPDSVMSNNFVLGTQWHQSNGIPISKMMIPHWSEIGPNAFAGLKAWGIEFVDIEIVPGTLEYETNEQSAWLMAGPYRLYETPMLGESLNPLFYADWLPIPGHPELNQVFFDPYTEIRNVRQGVTVIDGGDWDPDTDVAGTVSRATLQIKRGLDSLTLGNVFTHEDNIDPIPNATWLQIVQGITNNLASYNPAYVTMDYAAQYLRCKKTSHLTSAQYDPTTGIATVGVTGYADLATFYYVYTGADFGITNVTGTAPVFSGTISSTVQMTEVAPAIVSQPQNQMAPAGSPAAFTFQLTGTPPLYYQWLYNGSNLPAATNSFLFLPAAQPANGGVYSVIVTNAAGKAESSNATLTVTESVSITNQPASETVAIGGNATFSVDASGTTPIYYQWEFESNAISGATNSSLVLTNAQLTNSGNYAVVVSDALGGVTSSNALLIVDEPVTITNQPVDQLVAIGGNATFSVGADGTAPIYYQWEFESNAISGATNSSLVLANAQLTNSGNYAVVVSDAVGGVTSSNALLIVDEPVTITNQPVDQLMAVGGNATFSVGASGTTPIYYQWEFESNAISGATNSSLVLTNAQLTNSGNYAVVVSDAVGGVTSSNAFLTVIPPPLITNEPASQTVNSGASVSFNVGATGVGALGYQWEVGFQAITGATSNGYEIIQSQPANTGQYVVIVTNAGGSVTSDVAMLTVIAAPPPVLTAQLQSNIVLLTFTANPGQSYEVDYVDSSDLLDLDQWEMLTNLTAAGTNLTFSDSTTNSTQRYYRATVVYPPLQGQ